MTTCQPINPASRKLCTLQAGPPQTWHQAVIRSAATNIVGHPAGPTVNPYTPKCVNPPAASDWHYGRLWRGKSVNNTCTGA